MPRNYNALDIPPIVVNAEAQVKLGKLTSFQKRKAEQRIKPDSVYFAANFRPALVRLGRRWTVLGCVHIQPLCERDASRVVASMIP